MESDEESCSEFEEPAQILYDIVPYKEWEQEPEVRNKTWLYILHKILFSPASKYLLLPDLTDFTRLSDSILHHPCRVWQVFQIKSAIELPRTTLQREYNYLEDFAKSQNMEISQKFLYLI